MQNDASIVYVVDDQADVRRSLSLILKSAGYEVQTYGDGDAFLRDATPDLPFGCVLLDLRMRATDCLAVQRKLAARGLCHPVVAITAHGSVRLAVQMMKAGACDVLEKPYSCTTILRAIAAALAATRERRDAAQEAHEAEARIAALSPREAEVLTGMVAGQQNKLIAQELRISPRTVEIHRANLMAKLQARSLPEAVRMALSAGIRPVASNPQRSHR